jgi:hypothetical protein
MNFAVKVMMAKLKIIYDQGGLFAIVTKIYEVIIRALSNSAKNIYFMATPDGSFYFNGNKLKYFRHNYNLAYQNERTIEIPIAMCFLNTLDESSRILEVGNVLRNYGCKIKRDVLDKYDLLPGIINQDVISFSPKDKYNAIISISTIEHVGWDEPVRDPNKIPTALTNLRDNCLLPGGIILVSLPLGYNPFFDMYLKNGSELFSETYFIKRVSAANEWNQVQYADVIGSKFGEPFNNANVLFIGILRF